MSPWLIYANDCVRSRNRGQTSPNFVDSLRLPDRFEHRTRTSALAYDWVAPIYNWFAEENDIADPQDAKAFCCEPGWLYPAERRMSSGHLPNCLEPANKRHSRSSAQVIAAQLCRGLTTCAIRQQYLTGCVLSPGIAIPRYIRIIIQTEHGPSGSARSWPQTRSTTEATLHQVLQENLKTLLSQVEAETVAGLQELVTVEGIESDCAREKGGARCIVVV